MLLNFFKKCNFLVKWWIFTVLANFAIMGLLPNLIPSLESDLQKGSTEFLKSTEWVALYVVSGFLLISMIVEVVKGIQAYNSIKMLILTVRESHIRMILEKERKLLFFIMIAPILSIVIIPLIFFIPICSTICKVLFWINLRKVKQIVESYSKEK